MSKNSGGHASANATNNSNNTSSNGAAQSSSSTNASNNTACSLELNSIKLIAESIGVSNLSDEACRDIAADLAFTIKSIVLDAQKFARRSRRNDIVPSDIDYSLKVRLIEPIYGFHNAETVPFKCTTSSGGNGSGRSIFYVEDQILDLNDLISVNNKSVKLPNDFIINAHWLAIEGVQPSVPENPQLYSRELQKKEAIEGVSSKSREKFQIQQQQQQKRNLGDTVVKLKSILPHELSMEQQIYFKEITEACVGSDEQKRTEALNSLAVDPGLHQLLPRLVVFICEGVKLNIDQTNMAILIYLMRMAKSLVDNKSIYLEKYLHELMPSILSCQLSKQLCARPEQENHFALREFCARLIGTIIKTYSSPTIQLQPKTIKIYMNTMSADKTTYSTLFGCIVGIAELGNDICASLLFPLVKDLGEQIMQILDNPTTSPEKLPAEKIRNQVALIVANVLIEEQFHADDEFDYLVTEFGAYFGPLIHTQLMKQRSQKTTASHAQIAAAAAQNSSSKIIGANKQVNSQPVKTFTTSRLTLNQNFTTSKPNENTNSSSSTTTTTTNTNIDVAVRTSSNLSVDKNIEVFQSVEKKTDGESLPSSKQLNSNAEFNNSNGNDSSKISETSENMSETLNNTFEMDKQQKSDVNETSNLNGNNKQIDFDDDLSISKDDDKIDNDQQNIESKILITTEKAGNNSNLIESLSSSFSFEKDTFNQTNNQQADAISLNDLNDLQTLEFDDNKSDNSSLNTQLVKPNASLTTNAMASSASQQATNNNFNISNESDNLSFDNNKEDDAKNDTNVQDTASYQRSDLQKNNSIDQAADEWY